MRTFYTIMMLLGTAGQFWILFVLARYAPEWTWWITLPAYVLSLWGALAARDREQERAHTTT